MGFREKKKKKIPLLIYINIYSYPLKKEKKERVGQTEKIIHKHISHKMP
jgi:hypothetical protein